MKRNIKLCIILFVTIFLVACSDDFLTNDPIAQGTTVTFYTSYDNLNATATAAYGILDTYTLDVMYCALYQSASDDIECGGSSVNDWPQFQRVDRLTHSKNESAIAFTWAYPYKGIRMTNTVMFYAETVKNLEKEKALTEQAGLETAALIDLRVAEMHYLRAYYHFFLLQMYGGVPIVDELVDAEQFNTTARNSVAEVLHFVESDLLAAIPVLKTKSELGAEVGRASKGAAEALLAKAYLYEASYAKYCSEDEEHFAGCNPEGHCYDSALVHAQNVMNSGEYKLVGIDGERFNSWRAPKGGTIGGYRWIFTLDADNCDESVWEIQNQQDGAGWVYTRGTYMTIYTTVRKVFMDKAKTVISTDFGWSFNIPSKYLVAAFGNNDTRESNLHSAVMSETMDPRFSTTVGRDGDSVMASFNGVAKWYPMCFSNIPAGTISRKYECSTDEFSFGAGDSYGEGPMNIRLMRYADVVLIAAEAAYESEKTAEALTYINMIRTRARMSGDTGYPLDLTTISFEDIMHERRLEFAAEPQRLFDLVRWNKAYDFINGITLASMGEGFTVVFEKGKHEFFPIPAEETQNASGLIQYKKWQ